MPPSASRFLAYLVLLLPPLVVSFYFLASFPPPPPRSLSHSRARQIYVEDWIEEGGYVDLPMGRTRYWLAGPVDGKKIALIHGLSIPAILWGPLVPPLVAAGYRVLLYDLYGRGYSHAPEGAAYDTQLYVTQLALLLQHLGWQRTRLGGVSMGGAIAAAFVASFPALVEREVILLACAGLVESSDLPRTAKVMSSPFIQTLTANPLIYAYLRRLASRASPAPPTKPTPRLRRTSTPPPRTSANSCACNLRTSRIQPRRVIVAARGPVTGMKWAFESAGWKEGGCWLFMAPQTIPSRRRTRTVSVRSSRAQVKTQHSHPPPRPNPSQTKNKNKKSKTQTETRSDRVQVALIPDAGHTLTWTHAREVGEVVCTFWAGAGDRWLFLLGLIVDFWGGGLVTEGPRAGSSREAGEDTHMYWAFIMLYWRFLVSLNGERGILGILGMQLQKFHFVDAH
ncbi:Alpha/Beta hydrolase protein [Mycena leptocephala]|nr:Alpha/Beta hydrolase protein [Mycena leptocephala]